MTTIGQLQAAIDAVRGQGAELVVLKFTREGCAACRTTETLYENAARKFGSSGLFFTCDCLEARTFARASGVRVVPSVFIFAAGELHTAMRLSRGDWPAFHRRLCELSGRSFVGSALLTRAWRALRKLPRPAAGMTSERA